ncbi:unnamed protein product [Ectocarpus sp. 6 AP-2014]
MSFCKSWWCGVLYRAMGEASSCSGASAHNLPFILSAKQATTPLFDTGSTYPTFVVFWTVPFNVFNYLYGPAAAAAAAAAWRSTGCRGPSWWGHEQRALRRLSTYISKLMHRTGQAVIRNSKATPSIHE